MPGLIKWIKGIGRERRAMGRHEQYIEDGSAAESSQIWLSFDEFLAHEKFVPEARHLANRYKDDILRKLGHTADKREGTSFLNAFRREDGTCFVAYWVWKGGNMFHGLKPYYFPADSELAGADATRADLESRIREEEHEPMQTHSISVSELLSLASGHRESHKLSQLLSQMDAATISQLTTTSASARRRGMVLE